jgi:6-phosphogluconolactonase (cycloisomerase 2 family)
VTLLQVVAAARRPQHMVLHPSGNYLYVASAGYLTGASKLAAFSVDAAGLLTPVAEVTIPNEGAYRVALADLRPPASGAVPGVQAEAAGGGPRQRLGAD